MEELRGMAGSEPHSDDPHFAQESSDNERSSAAHADRIVDRIQLRFHRVRRDRHGRGMRGPVLPARLPAWRTRAQMFDDVIAWDLGTFRRYLGEKMDRFDFAVIDVPHSDPAPWEDGVPLGRVVPFERPSKLEARIIFYRMPILEQAGRHPFPRMFIHEVVTNHLASALGEYPEDIDYIRSR
ncbi:MAG: metallopeptidase family protein [Actinomycetaceae bacterium]|nr:metallopeptidase family protein [Actinomycetaceae bacterium]MDY5854050.1 metallopeptidase family protein [Arcanobacterium sp.]